MGAGLKGLQLVPICRLSLTSEFRDGTIIGTGVIVV